MEIIYRKGDLLECNEPWILQGVNCQGVMGSGVAKDIRIKYPTIFDCYIAYINECKQKSAPLLGGLCWTSFEDGKFVFNGFTQEFYGRDGKQYVDYKAVEDVMKGMNWFAERRYGMYNDGFPQVAMPKIGAGLGGGDWGTIACIIEDNSTNFQPVVYIKD